MHSLGLTLIVVGALSFLIPLFDRQFGLVTLLGLTGIGAALAGVVLLILGGILISAGRRQSNTVGSGMPTLRATATVPNKDPESMSTRTGSAAVTEVARADSSTADGQSINGGVFLIEFPLEDGSSSAHRVSPSELATIVVNWAADSSAGTIRDFCSKSQSKLWDRIASGPRPAQIHLMALQVASFSVYTTQRLYVPGDVTSEIVKGTVDGFMALEGMDAAGTVGHFLKCVDAYSSSLKGQVNFPHSSNAFTADISRTLRLVATNIARDYGAVSELENDAMQLDRMQIAFTPHEILFMTALNENFKLQYVREISFPMKAPHRHPLS